MKSIIKEIIEAHEKALQPDEIDNFLTELETSLLLLRFKHRNFDVKYNEEFFSKPKFISQSNYTIPLWGFLYYSKREYKTVLDVINSFVKYDFGFLSEVDFERTSSGPMRAYSNFRFAGAKLKDWGVVSIEKKDNWSAFRLTKLGTEQWQVLEGFLTDKRAALRNKPFDAKYFHNQEFYHFKSSKMIVRLINELN